jgi:N-acetyl-gamma-glutamyl-phosphate reductase
LRNKSVSRIIERHMSFKIGIVGVSGYGGGEALRLCAGHPSFQVVYVGGETSAGGKLGERFPGLPAQLGELVIQKWDPEALPADLDLLFASFPTGESREALAKVSRTTKIVDIGGDHRFADGWAYGLADVWPEKIQLATRVANPGCYPAAALGVLAPLVAKGIIDTSDPIIIDAKSGVSGGGRGGGSTFGFAEVNEDVAAYGLLKHAHVAEMDKALSELRGEKTSVLFTPHLIPMTRGILATCYGRARATTEQCLAAARQFFANRPFVRVLEKPPHTKWAMGSNLLHVSYAADEQRGIVIALGAIDNLGKGAAGQAVQNANLMLGLPETAGLLGAPLWP